MLRMCGNADYEGVGVGVGDRGGGGGVQAMRHRSRYVSRGKYVCLAAVIVVRDG